MKTLIATTALSLALTVAAGAQQGRKPFPAHWGEPPQIQTQDYGDLPGGFGKGSSTLANWIAANLAKDAQAAKGGAKPASPAAQVVYEQNFEKAEVDKAPSDFLVLEGGFAVKAEGGNKFLELPGSPLPDSDCGVLFGPTQQHGLRVQARAFGTRQGRRFPAMGVGLNGTSGFKLMVSPAKGQLVLTKSVEGEDRPIANAPYEWQSGTWTVVRLQVTKVKDNTWKVDGKAWAESTKEPAAWQITYEHVATDPEKDAPRQGRPAIWAMPYAGTPIRFDDLLVTKAQ